MKIAAIHLNNFKSYKGVHKIDNLDKGLDKHKNIILIGGLNGAGKTSFLEALILCFYGKDADNLYPTRGARYENYEMFVKSLLNKDVLQSKKNILLEEQIKMDVEILLKEVNFTRNVSRDISIRREWIFYVSQGSIRKFDEELKILNESGEQYLPLDLRTATQNEYEERQKEYLDLINDILPHDISQFFFFDGEKIQDFAADPSERFGQSLKNVLGIGLYDNLYKDLQKVKSNIIKDFNSNIEATKKLSEKENDLKTIQGQISDNLVKITELDDEIEVLTIEEEKKRRDVKRITNINADNTEDFRQQKRDLEGRKKLLEERYIDLSKVYMPFILTYDLCKAVDKQLDEEEKFNAWQTTEKALFPKLEMISKEIFAIPPIPDISNDQRIHYQNRIMSVLNKFLSEGKPNNLENLKMIHNLSSDERRTVKDLISLLEGSLVEDLVAISNELKDIDITLERIKRTEVRMDDGSDEINKKLSELSAISQKIGKKRQLKSDLFDANRELKRDIDEIKKGITHWTKKVKLKAAQQKQIDYCDKLRKTIKLFINEFQSKRISELEFAILEMWKRLARKKYVIKNIKIEIDQNFDIILLGFDNEPIDKTKISAGEKEIYAICLLSALVKVSGRKIPIIIDTPYGRLDSKHRKSLVKSYFPNAGEQVFILSQDEEIVGDFYKTLKPHIAKEFTIIHNQETNKSEITEGYAFA